jgi:hypothetical protein
MMSGQPGQWRQWVENLAQRFRAKGAMSPERAMTAQELGLHERFEEAMKRRLGQTGIFVETSGKYYLNEERLREYEQRWQGSGAGYGAVGRPRGTQFALRIVRMILGVIIMVLFLVNILIGRSWELWYIIVALIIVWICVSVVQIFGLARKTRSDPTLYVGLLATVGLSDHPQVLVPQTRGATDLAGCQIDLGAFLQYL